MSAKRNRLSIVLLSWVSLRAERRTGLHSASLEEAGSSGGCWELWGRPGTDRQAPEPLCELRGATFTLPCLSIPAAEQDSSCLLSWLGAGHCLRWTTGCLGGGHFSSKPVVLELGWWARKKHHPSCVPSLSSTCLWFGKGFGNRVFLMFKTTMGLQRTMNFLLMDVERFSFLDVIFPSHTSASWKHHVSSAWQQVRDPTPAARLCVEHWLHGAVSWLCPQGRAQQPSSPHGLGFPLRRTDGSAESACVQNNSFWFQATAFDFKMSCLASLNFLLTVSRLL